MSAPQTSRTDREDIPITDVHRGSPRSAWNSEHLGCFVLKGREVCVVLVKFPYFLFFNVLVFTTLTISYLETPFILNTTFPKMPGSRANKEKKNKSFEYNLVTVKLVLYIPIAHIVRHIISISLKITEVVF